MFWESLNWCLDLHCQTSPCPPVLAPGSTETQMELALSSVVSFGWHLDVHACSASPLGLWTGCNFPKHQPRISGIELGAPDRPGAGFRGADRFRRNKHGRALVVSSNTSRACLFARVAALCHTSRDAQPTLLLILLILHLLRFLTSCCQYSPRDGLCKASEPSGPGRGDGGGRCCGEPGLFLWPGLKPGSTPTA